MTGISLVIYMHKSLETQDDSCATTSKNLCGTKNNKRLTTKDWSLHITCVIPLWSTKSAQGRHSHATNHQQKGITYLQSCSTPGRSHLPVTGKTSSFVKNSPHFVEKVNKLKVPDSTILVSFDVKSTWKICM